jgi:hypothetical protein
MQRGYPVRVAAEWSGRLAVAALVLPARAWCRIVLELRWWRR